MIFRTSCRHTSQFFKPSQSKNTFSLVLISLLFSALHYTQILKEVLVSLKQVSIKENLVLLSFRLFMHCKCRSKSLVMTARFPVIPNSCKKSLQSKVDFFKRANRILTTFSIKEGAYLQAWGVKGGGAPLVKQQIKNSKSKLGLSFKLSKSVGICMKNFCY